MAALAVGTVFASSDPCDAKRLKRNSNSALPVDVSVGEAKSVLDLNDLSSSKLLMQMASDGNQNNRLFAEAWIVTISVAHGMGLEKCHFVKPDDISFLWKPATDALSNDEILTLNRVVTSNFRNSERNGHLMLDRLFPITRQAVMRLRDVHGNWDCQEISRVC